MQATILAGGKGERMGEFTKTNPKPMVPILGEPLIDHQLRQLKANGITDVAVYESSHFPEKLQEHLGDGSALDMHLEHRVVDFGLGTRGVIQDALEQLPQGEENLLVYYGDIYYDGNELPDLIAKQGEEHPYGTFLVLERPNPHGVVTANGDRVVGFREKPPIYESAGVFVVNRKLLDVMRDPKYQSDETDFSKWLENVVFKGENPRFPEGLLFLQVNHKVDEGGGYWYNVTTEGDVDRINEREGRVTGEQHQSSTPEGK